MRTLTIALILLSTGAVLWAQDADIVATAYQTVNVRRGPGTQYEIIGQLDGGDTVPVLGRGKRGLALAAYFSRRWQR